MKAPFTVIPRTSRLVLGGIFIAGVLFFSGSPLLLLLFFIIVYAAKGPFSVRTKKFLGVLALSLIAAPYFRWAGFESSALDRAHKDTSGSFGSHYLCAPLVIQDWTSLAGVKASEPLEANEARAVRSSSNGNVWFAGPPCQTEGTARLALSWLALAAPPLYGFYLLRGRSRDRVFEQNLIST